MNARVAILKGDSSFQSLSRRYLYLYCLVVFALLIGFTFLQRYIRPVVHPLWRDISPEEQRHVAAAEEICRKIAPDIDQFQLGLVTQSAPPSSDRTVRPFANKGYIAVQLSDLEEKRHFHVVTMKIV